MAQNQFQFGIIVCIVLLNDSVEKVYNVYKYSEQFEPVSDKCKNSPCERQKYIHSGKELHRRSLLNFIVRQTYYRLFTHLKNISMLKEHPVSDSGQHYIKGRNPCLCDNDVDTEMNKYQLSINLNTLTPICERTYCLLFQGLKQKYEESI